MRIADDAVLGEAVINDLDAANAAANYRISLVGPEVFGRGYGTEATRLVVAYALDVAGLHRLHLQVFDFNPRAQRAYERCGSSARASTVTRSTGRARGTTRSRWESSPPTRGRPRPTDCRSANSAHTRRVSSGVYSTASGTGVRLVRKGRATSNSTEPHIRLLGGFSVAVGDNVVSDRAWRLRKAKALVKILALAPDRRMHRERLAELLWPDRGADAAANNLNQALYSARRALDATGADGAATLAMLDGAVVLRARG